MAQPLAPQVAQLLQGLQADSIDASWKAILPDLVDLTNTYEEASRGLAINYFDSVRSLQVSGAQHTSILAPEKPLRMYEVSFGVTGPSEVKKSISDGLTFDQGISKAMITLQGAVDRHVTNAGRDTITENIKKDKQAVGWQRLSSTGSPCYFCAMLISRGPVYKSKKQASFQSHDTCHCFPEPMYIKGDWAPVATNTADLWKKATKGLSGKDAINAFRRAWERPHLHNTP